MADKAPLEDHLKLRKLHCSIIEAIKRGPEGQVVAAEELLKLASTKDMLTSLVVAYSMAACALRAGVPEDALEILNATVASHDEFLARRAAERQALVN